jgi:WD40 repeat protein
VSNFSTALHVFSFDGELIAVGLSRDVYIWNVNTGTMVKRLEGEEYHNLTSIAFSPTENILTSFAQSGSILIWDLGTEPSVKITSEGGSYDHHLFMPDGKTLITSDGTGISKWSIDHAEHIGDLSIDQKRMTSVAISPNGNSLISGNENGDLILWNVENDQLIQEIGGNSYKVFSFVFLADGETIALETESSGIVLWNYFKEEVVSLLESDYSLCPLAYSEKKNFLASADMLIIRLWDLNEMKEVKLLEGHTAQITSVDFSNDGKFLASGSNNGTIILWDVKSGEEINRIEGYYNITTLSFSPISDLLAFGGMEGLFLFNKKEKIAHQILEMDPDTFEAIGTIKFSHDGNYLAAAKLLGNEITIWEMKNFEVVDISQENLYLYFMPNQSVFDFSIDDKLLVYMFNSHDEIGINAWNIESNAEYFITDKIFNKNNITYGYNLAFSPDQNFIATANAEDGVFVLWGVP